MARRRRRNSSPAPAELPDDILWDILLRLPPLPSSLVCRRWRHLVTDPGFLRRFRAHHHHRKAGPPLLGFFHDTGGGSSHFTPLLDAPDRIPAARFARPRPPSSDACSFLDCRHGLALTLNRRWDDAVVWNPITGDQQRVPFPSRADIVFNAAVLRPAGGNHDPGRLNPFGLVLLCSRFWRSRLKPLFARIYRSESRKWVTTGSTAALMRMLWRPVVGPSVMVGNTLCWLIGGGDILQLDLDTQSLAVMNRPL